MIMAAIVLFADQIEAAGWQAATSCYAAGLECEGFLPSFTAKP